MIASAIPSNRLDYSRLAACFLLLRGPGLPLQRGAGTRAALQDALSRLFMAKRSERRSAPLESWPSIHAVPFNKAGAGGFPVPLLTVKQRRQLAALATRQRLPPRTVVFHEGDALSWVFIDGDGVLKSFRELPSGKRRIVAFLFPDDVFGLAENGRYVNTVGTVTGATVFRIPYETLAAALQRDPELEFQFLSKVTHELRATQRQTLVLGRRDAAGRLAMFLIMLERNMPQPRRAGRIPVLMSRTDIAEYLGLSLEAVSRATRDLARKGIVEFEGSHSVRVLDRNRFELLAEAL
jgi:CRP-like cAMP-binding protein